MRAEEEEEGTKSYEKGLRSRLSNPFSDTTTLHSWLERTFVSVDCRVIKVAKTFMAAALEKLGERAGFFLPSHLDGISIMKEI